MTRILREILSRIAARLAASIDALLQGRRTAWRDGGGDDDHDQTDQHKHEQCGSQHLGTLLALGVGFLGTFRLLGKKPLGVLRGE